MSQKEEILNIIRTMKQKTFDIRIASLNENDHNAHLWWDGYASAVADVLIKVMEIK